MKDLAERCARASGWQMNSATVDPESETVWLDGDKIICAVVDFDPLTDANQAMMLWDDTVADGWLLTLEEDKEEVIIHFSRGDDGDRLQAPTKNEAICLAFLRASGEGKNGRS